MILNVGLICTSSADILSYRNSILGQLEGNRRAIMVNGLLITEQPSFHEQSADFFSFSQVEKEHIQTKQEPHNQLLYAVLLKFFECEGRFPSSDITTEVSAHILTILAEQLNLPSNELEWPPSRTLNRFRARIRIFLGYREMSAADKTDLASWLSKNILPHAPDDTELFDAAVFFCRHHKIELFAKAAMERFLVSTARTFEEELFVNVAKILGVKTKEGLDQLTEDEPENDNEDEGIPINKRSPKKFILNSLKRNTSHLKKESIYYEIDKYSFLKDLQLPQELARAYPRKILLKYTARIKGTYPSHISSLSLEVRHSQLALFCLVKSQQSADILTDIVLKLLNRIQKRAERHVDKYVLSEIKKVKGKFDTLLTLAETLTKNPKGIIEEEVYPKVSETILVDIIKELHHRQKWYQNQVRVKALSFYNHGYRAILKDLLKALTFETDNTNYQELIRAVEWINKDPAERSTENRPYQEEVLKSWGNFFQRDSFEETSVSFDLKAYELAILEHFSTALFVKNIWVKGAYRYQNPLYETPADFDQKKDFYFEWLELPTSGDEFVKSLKEELEESLLMLNENLPTNNKVKLVNRKKGAIKVTPSSPQELPTNLHFLHNDISRLWPDLPMIDVIKEVDFRVGFSKNFKNVGFRNKISPETLQKRLLLCIYGLGSNVGLKRVASAHTGETYGDLRYVKNRYLESGAIRLAIQDVVNAILKERDPEIWGENIVGCAGDSKRFNVWVQNLFGAWHGRYRAHGLMVYTHIDTKSAPIYMQITRPGDSEVGAMLMGCLNHDTDMNLNKMYTDTHGQSCIGFALGRLIHTDLLPRIKGIHKQKLFVPSKSFKDKIPHLRLALASDPINFGKITNCYEEVVKHVAALKTKIVDADVLLKRLSAGNANHPVYQALMEIGKAQRTIFLCRYLSDESLRIQINEALNIVERFNGMLSFIFHGKQGEITTNDKEDQELSILALHLVLVCIIYMNTLIIQEVLSNPSRSYRLTKADLRALTPMIHGHINPHGIVILDMAKRLNLKQTLMQRQKVFK